MSKQTIVIFGATGNQGGSVINSILGDSKAAAQFHIKAVTRDPSKDKAKALAHRGAEVITVCYSTIYMWQMKTNAIVHEGRP